MDNRKFIEKICDTDRSTIIASLLGNILHDINSPLTGMDINFKTLSHFIQSCNTQLLKLKESITDPALIDFLENDLDDVLSEINTGFDTVISVIKNLNIMSNRPPHYIADKINLNDVIENCLILINNRIKRISLKKNFDDNIVRFQTDLCKLESLIINLLLHICDKIPTDKNSSIYIHTVQNPKRITMTIGYPSSSEQDFFAPTEIPLQNIKTTLEIKKNTHENIEYILNFEI